MCSTRELSFIAAEYGSTPTHPRMKLIFLCGHRNIRASPMRIERSPMDISVMKV